MKSVSVYKTAIGLNEGCGVTLKSLGKYILLAPQVKKLDAARLKMQQNLLFNDLSPDAILCGLRKERQLLFEEIYKIELA